MKTTELDLMRFLPEWMRTDETAQGLVYAVQNQLNTIAAEVPLVLLYSRISTMDEALLDEIAWGLSIPEYRSEYDADIKRRLVQTAIQTHRTRGTVAAVEKIVTDIFGDGWIEEWFDYTGDPYHFKIHTSNIGAVDADAEEFDHAVKTTKNLRSVLEEIVITAATQMQLYAAGVLHVRDAIFIEAE